MAQLGLFTSRNLVETRWLHKRLPVPFCGWQV